jgi:phosphate uptake regulator
VQEPSQRIYKEEHKIQITCKYTYIQSLPKKWIKELHHEVGDQVMLVLEPESDSLSMFIGAEKAGASNAFAEDLIDIFSDEGVETLKRKIVSIYLADYTTIYLKIESRTRMSSPLLMQLEIYCRTI